MTIAPLRTVQTTTTTGTGTLTLIAAATNVRSFNTALGSSSIVTHYCISSAANFEIGIGTYDGGTPGTLSRTTIIASSNSGSAVSLPAGTHDVFIPFVPGERGVRTGTGSDSLNATAWGEAYVWTGTGNQTLTFSVAATTIPAAASLLVINAGTAILTVDANSTETIGGTTTKTLYPGQWAEIFRRGSNFDAIGNFNMPSIMKWGSGSTTAGVGSVTFATAFPNLILADSINIQIKGGTSATPTTKSPLIVAGTPSVSGFDVVGAVGDSLSFSYQVWGA